MKKALFYVVMFLFIQVVVTSLFSLANNLLGQSKLSTGMYIASLSLFSLVVIVVFAWCRWTPVNRKYMRSRPWVVLIWSALAALGAILPSLWLQDVLPELPNFIEDEFEDILSNRWGYFAVGLFAPIAEEFVFRGAALRSLLNGTRKPWVAIILSALLFSLAHLNPAQMLHAFLVGLLLGWMYWRTGSIIPGIVYHWVNNTVAYVGENLLPGQTDHLSDLFGGNQQSMMLSILFSLCIFVPAIYQLHLNMRKVE
jgi:membrane protease YdiL (CAAX protease family)